ncbi:hypothetical protein GCM10025767_35480 [Thalassotalea piscium]
MVGDDNITSATLRSDLLNVSSSLAIFSKIFIWYSPRSFIYCNLFSVVITVFMKIYFMIWPNVIQNGILLQTDITTNRDFLSASLYIMS